MKKYVPLIIAVLAIAMITLSTSNSYTFPERYQIADFPLCRQPDNITCGPTSTLMVLKYYKKDVTRQVVETETKTEWFTYNGQRIGMTAPDYVARALKRLGVPARMELGNLEKLKFYVSANKPVIVLLRSGQYTWHYVVVVGYDESKITIADPGGGIRWNMTNEHFIGSWKFITDMSGEDTLGDCPVCGGSGKWFGVDLGPITICDICSGTGKQPDYLSAALAAAEVRPLTMIVPYDNVHP